MEISLRYNSDRLALLTGNPKLISLKYSTNPRTLARTLPRRPEGERKNVLLLGGNGFVGMHMLRELLANDRVDRVYALVRGKGEAGADKRVARQLRKYKMELPDSDRLTVLEGSYLEPEMGLDKATFAALQGEVDVVIDAAGATTHEYPYARYRREKVVPALRLAEFCLRDRYKSLHIIGSVGSEVYQQRRDFFRRSFFYCGYSKMKWVVKHLSLRANKHGVPVHVYQAPFALGGPHTGYRDPGMDYSFWNMVEHMLRIGRTWRSDHTIPIVAGDVLARLVVNNALSAEPRRISYPVTPVTTIELAERLGLEVVPWAKFRRSLVRENKFRLSEVNWSNPVSSTLRGLRQARFVRSLFPRSFPTLLGNIHAAAGPTAPRVGTGPRPADVLFENAKRIRKLRRLLPEHVLAETPAPAEKAA